jgi:hypothetical protein
MIVTLSFLFPTFLISAGHSPKGEFKQMSGFLHDGGVELTYHRLNLLLSVGRSPQAVAAESLSSLPQV